MGFGGTELGLLIQVVSRPIPGLSLPCHGSQEEKRPLCLQPTWRTSPK